MRLFTLLLCCVLVSLSVNSQTDLAKLSSDIRKVSGEWLTDFKNIKGAVVAETEIQTLFATRLKITGAIGNTNKIHYVKDKEKWSFTADFDGSVIQSATLDSLIQTIAFSFGNVKPVPSKIVGTTTYVPAVKKDPSLRLKSFFLLVYDRSKEPNDKSNGLITLIIGEEEYFWNK